VNRGRLVLAGALVLYLALAGGMALTRSPWCDEAWFASPAWNLVEHGHMGTTVYVPENERAREGFDRETYWVPPLHFVAQAAWYEVAGFGLVQLRLLSVVFGALSVVSCFVIARSLFEKDPRIAALAVFLCATDNIFCVRAGDGRMDVMSAALGHAGLAAYLLLREKRLPLATLAGHALVAASGLTHPNGILHFAALVAFQITDRARLTKGAVGAALLPYVVGGAAWGAYIAHDPHAFLSQFGKNMSGRLYGLGSPVLAVLDEVRSRYLVNFGWNEAAPAWTRIRLFVPLAAFGALVGATVRKDTRVVALVTWLMLGMLTFVIGNKSSSYLVNVTPLAAILLAAVLLQIFEGRGRVAALALGLALVGIQVGTSVVQIRRDPRHADFQPAIAFIEQASSPRDDFVGSAELAFGLGFDRVRDDPSLESIATKSPSFVVLDPTYDRYTRENAGPGGIAFRERYALVGASGPYVLFRRVR
jgi:4-amino-4-deoxy-L-arabinose transferase-like glycosyltransferase